MVENRRSRKRLILIAMIGIGLFGLLAGAANAAIKSIQLNSAASFPVDI